jgi:hypothetical protein
MAATTQSTSRTTHLLALMKKGDDAFNARDFEGMKAVHHPQMVAHVTGKAESIKGQPAHAAMMQFLDLKDNWNPLAFTRLPHRRDGVSVCHLVPDRVTKQPRHDVPDFGLASVAEFTEGTEPLLNNKRLDVVQVLASPLGEYPLP